MEDKIEITDSRINRDNNIMGYMELTNEFFAANGINKKVSCDHNGSMMSWDEFKTTAYRHGCNDFQASILMNFNSHTAVITIN